MYDRRLKDWNITKNLKKAQKEDMVTMLVETGTWSSPSTPNEARHIEMSASDHAKVIRHVKAQAKNSSSPRSPASPTSVVGVSTKATKVLKSKRVSSADTTWVYLSPATSTRPDFETPCGSHNAESIDDSNQPIPDSSAAEQDYISPFDLDVPDGVQHVSDLIPEQDFEIFPPLTMPLRRLYKTFDMQSLLMGIRVYSESAKLPTSVNYSSAQPKQVNSTLLEQVSPSAEFWSDLKHGIYLFKLSPNSKLGWTAMEKACASAPFTLRNPNDFDFVFLRELCLTLSPVNTRVCPKLRIHLLQYLSYLAFMKLGSHHPVATICHELQQDENDREVSETALKYILECLRSRAQTEPQLGDVEELAFKIECSIITLLRRDRAYYAAAEKAKVLLKKCQRQILAACFNFSRTPATDTVSIMRRARTAATELAHIRMDQRGNWYDEAIEHCMFALTTNMKLSTEEQTWPPLPDNVTEYIKDKKAVHTLEDLAKIYDELALPEQSLMWLEKARLLAEALYGSEEESVATAHIVEKMNVLHEKLSASVEDMVFM